MRRMMLFTGIVLIVFAVGAHSLRAEAEQARGKAEESLIGYWRFEEGEGVQVKDSSAAGNHGTIMHAGRGVTWTDGRLGKGLKFIAGGKDERDTAGCVLIPKAGAHDFSKGMTIEMWVKFTRFEPGQYFELANTDRSGRGPGWRFGCYPGTRMCFSSRGGPGSKDEWEVQGGKVFKTRVWYHLAGTFDGSVYRVYVNGTELHASDPGQKMTTGRSRLYLGSWGGGAYGLNGVMDEVKLYNRGKSVAEIGADAAAGPWKNGPERLRTAGGASDRTN